MPSKQNLARRSFLLYGGALALTSVTASTSLATALLEHEVLPSCVTDFSHADHLCLREFSLQDFTHLLGQQFSVGAGKQQVRMQLFKATSYVVRDDARPSHVRREPFSLVFVAPQELNLPADIYDLRHPQIGGMKVMMTKIGQAEAGKSRYEVVFG
jgi:hypothetical protein